MITAALRWVDMERQHHLGKRSFERDACGEEVKVKVQRTGDPPESSSTKEVEHWLNAVQASSPPPVFTEAFDCDWDGPQEGGTMSSDSEPSPEELPPAEEEAFYGVASSAVTEKDILEVECQDGAWNPLGGSSSGVLSYQENDENTFRDSLLGQMRQRIGLHLLPGRLKEVMGCLEGIPTLELCSWSLESPPDIILMASGLLVQ